MAAVHEVIDRDGTCLYRGHDVELACEVYDAAAPGARLRSWRGASRRTSAGNEPVPYALTVAGYAATTARPVAIDEPVPYALTARAADLFVVDTTNVTELRRRCPELFAPRKTGGAS